MSKQKVYILIGLPGSGKSTWSERQLSGAMNPRGCSIVSRDAIRYMLNGNYRYIEEQQDLITSITAASAKAVLLSGQDLVIDQANINREDRKEVTDFIIREVGDRDDVVISFIYLFEGDTETLVKRRMAGDPRGEVPAYHGRVIEKLKKKFEEVSDEEDYDFFITVSRSGHVIDTISKSREGIKKDALEEIPLEELWDLHHTLAKYIYPRLKAFREKHCGSPGYLGNDRKGNPLYSERYGPDNRKKLCFQLWDETLDKMVLAFELWLSSDDWDCDFNSKEHDKRWSQITEGFNLFMKHFNGLWW